MDIKLGMKVDFTDGGRFVYPDIDGPMEVGYMTARAVMLVNNKKQNLTVPRALFEHIFKEVKSRGRKAASSKQSADSGSGN